MISLLFNGGHFVHPIKCLPKILNDHMWYFINKTSLFTLNRKQNYYSQKEASVSLRYKCIYYNLITLEHHENHEQSSKCENKAGIDSNTGANCFRLGWALTITNTG